MCQTITDIKYLENAETIIYIAHKYFVVVGERPHGFLFVCSHCEVRSRGRDSRTHCSATDLPEKVPFEFVLFFYSIPRDDLLASLHDCIDASTEVNSRNSSSALPEPFFELLDIYWQPMCAEWEAGVSAGEGISHKVMCDPCMSDFFSVNLSHPRRVV